MQIKKKSSNINPFGGINFINNTILKSGIKGKIDEFLGARGPQANYSYSDVLLSLFYTQYTGGSCLEDVKELKEHLGKRSSIKICSPDVIGDVCNDLKTPNEVYISDNKVRHEFNINIRANELLAEINECTGMLKRGIGYTMDYDNIALENEKYDSKRTYKMFNGYQPGVAFIGKLPVYIEGRNGNSNAKYKMEDTLERCFSIMNKKGIRIEDFRSDCAAYQKGVINLVESNAKYFHIRAMASAGLYESCREIENWEKVEINDIEFEVGETTYSPFGESKTYRIVVTRKIRKDKQIDIYSKTAYDYYGILTNNYEKTPKDVLVYYNNRAAAEPNFDILNNDFNWSHLPFSFLNQNTVFMILSAISLIIFEWIKKLYSKIVDFINPKMRMKKFVHKFVTVPVRWIKQARRMVLVIYSEKKYELLL